MNTRHNDQVFTAWQTITSAEGQTGSGGRIQAIEFLNSRPLKFPWIGWTIDLFWDRSAKTCKEKTIWGLRREREILKGLSAPGAYLSNIKLCKANLLEADLKEAILSAANLQQAQLSGANLQEAILAEAKNYTYKQIKLSCNWKQAIFKRELNIEKREFIVKEPDNTNFIKQIDADKASDPETPPDCDRWN